MNRERAACSGRECPLPPLKLLPLLVQVANRHSRAMALGDFFSHCDPSGSLEPWDRLQRAGYGYSAAAENIAGGATTPAAAMAQWMQSPLHRANILSADYRELGVGYFRQDGDRGNVDRDGNGDCDCRDRGETCRGEALTHYWTQLLGRREGVHPLVIASEQHATASAAVELYLYGPADATAMRLRNGGESWSAWREFADRSSWTLAAGAGQKFVFAEVRSDRGIHRSCDRIWLSGEGRPAQSAERIVCEDDGTFRADEP